MADELLPCEICNAMVSFSSYTDHVSRCMRATRIMGFIRRQIEENESTEEEEESNDAHESEIVDMSRHFTNNAQVSRMSLHDFITNHFNGVSSPPTRNIVWFNISGINTGNPTENGSYESNLRLGERMGNVEVGLTEDQLQEVSYSSTKADELVVNNEDVCPICQENILALIKESKPACILACGHIYCDSCIKHWLGSHKKCPVCMVDLEDAYCWGR